MEIRPVGKNGVTDEKFGPQGETLRQVAKVWLGRPLVGEKVRAAIERAMM
jgi:hypothetical protein